MLNEKHDFFSFISIKILSKKPKEEEDNISGAKKKQAATKKLSHLVKLIDENSAQHQNE